MKKLSPLSVRLREARRSAQMTQEQLARAAGIPYATLTKVENGAIKNPSAEVVAKLASALNISVDLLLVTEQRIGSESLQDLWSDILSVLRNKGDCMYLSGIRERTFLAYDKAGLMEYIGELKRRGIGQRLLISEEDSVVLPGEHLEYRQIPRKHFNPTPMYIYGDRVALVLWKPLQVTILKNQTIADAFLKQFDFIWKHAQPLKRRIKPKRAKT